LQSSLSPTDVVDQALAVRATQAEQDRVFLTLSPAQRVAAMWRFLGASDPDATAGEPVRLTMNTLYRWAQRLPSEVPLIDGEFAFIAAAMPEYADTPGAIDRARRDHEAAKPQSVGSVAARLRAEAERLRAIADAEAKS
jgi:hypothetical protein